MHLGRIGTHTRDGRFPWRGAALLLLAAALVFGAATLLRGTEYDENYSVFVTGGIARPAWPTTPFTATEVPAPFHDHADLGTVTELIRRTDVHPPLYFWLLHGWRAVVGDGLPALRLLSVVCALGALLAWMRAAWLAGLPPLVTGALLALSYGFGLTGHVVRGYALAHLLVGLTVLAAVAAWRKPGLLRAGLAGLAGGLACLTNYLAVFPVGVVLAWLVLTTPGWGRRLRVALVAGVPCLALLGMAGSVWLSQRASAVSQSAEQFDALPLLATLARLAQYEAAILLGGLPLYVPAGLPRAALGAALVLLLVAVALAMLWRWRGLGPLRWMWLAAALAPPLGLLVLGALFGTVPVELRYLVLGAPFFAVLGAATVQAWYREAPRAAAWGLGLVLAVQAAGTLGMVLHPATQQPFRAAVAALAPALRPPTLLLVPFGQDGVGIVGSLLRELPPDQPILVLRTADAAAVPDRVAGACRLLLLGFGERDRASAAQVAAAAAALAAAPGWREDAVLWREERGGLARLYLAGPGCMPGAGRDTGQERR
ncbi:hypothetical protein GCM10011504_14020 [Siccirubricoccus deserti]|uniref:Glycosyltransferase family 39 protein n=1 Tax=Siccirubricoccus deserti TaxID=2013562 RepID=A0A9X0QW12_9PROT|nr:glycosyltransferase family 39 protein [Siccirubricoccus deserti]MBC4014946.1 glycosyltransferase family 39 protein [Siccirubricoccus deserti]GGC36870.1 hypothetical protein GCM10011504_14020 [Siccirubricoccus deserti]